MGPWQLCSCPSKEAWLWGVLTSTLWWTQPASLHLDHGSLSSTFSLCFTGEQTKALELPRWDSGKESTCQCRRLRIDPRVGKIPWSRKWQPTPVFLPGKFHGQRSLVGYSPWGCKELDPTEHLRARTHAHQVSGNRSTAGRAGEDPGNPGSLLIVTVFRWVAQPLLMRCCLFPVASPGSTLPGTNGNSRPEDLHPPAWGEAPCP